jgi:uncharacterized delta-60 repeat protein
MKNSSPALIAALAAAIAFTACGGDDADDHDHDEDPDAAIDPEPDANEDEPDAEPAPDAPDSPLPDPTPVPVRLSMTGADGFNGVAFGPDGSFYAIGYTTIGASDRATVFAKFTPEGALDTSWGSAGVVTVNVTVGGGTAEVGRAIAIQPSGKIVGVSLIEADILAVPPASNDRDVAVIRLNTDGGLDSTFDADGVRIISFNTGVLNGAAWAGADDIRDVEIDSMGRIVLFGGQLTTETNGAPRYDLDWVAQRLTVDGADDTTFNAAGPVPGKFTLDILDAGANIRSGFILPDGSLLGTGYSNTSAFNSTQPVIYKLTPNGTLDTSWAQGAGFFHEQVLLNVTEVYGVAMQGEKLVTQGYGRDSTSETNDWVSLRINADGTLDSTWGTSSRVRIDFHGFGDNGRSIVGLPDGRVMLTGSGDLAAADARDAKIVVLSGDGEYDTSFRTDGVLGYDLGGTSDAFWASALSPDGTFAVAVGTKGVGSTQTAASNDDAAIMVIPLE